MRVEEFTAGPREAEIVAGMILSRTVLGRIASRWNGILFSSPQMNILASLCVDYHGKYGKAPKRGISSLIESWADNRSDDRTQQVLRALEGLPLDFDRGSKGINPDHLVDVAAKHFRIVAAGRLADSIKQNLDIGQLEKAEQSISSFGRLDLGSTQWMRVLTDREEIKSTWAESSGSIVSYPHGLGTFFHQALERDAFISFLAPNKSLKSFWLLDMAWRAMQQRRKTAYFVVGDLSRNQVKRRMLSRLTKRPFRSPTGDWPYVVKYPNKIERGNGPELAAAMGHDPKSFTKPLDEKTAWEAACRTMAEEVKSQKDYLLTSVYPSRGIGVAGIRSELEMLDQDGFVVDVCVIDSADNLAPADKRMDRRDQINEVWQALRALSQERHCLLVTATQADSDSFKRGLIDRSNFSEDRRKLDHVTGMVGINITSEERESGTCRLNWVATRDGDFSPRQVVWVAGCLAVANPAVLSVF